MIHFILQVTLGSISTSSMKPSLTAQYKTASSYHTLSHHPLYFSHSTYLEDYFINLSTVCLNQTKDGVLIYTTSSQYLMFSTAPEPLSDQQSQMLNLYSMFLYHGYKQPKLKRYIKHHCTHQLAFCMLHFLNRDQCCGTVS